MFLTEVQQSVTRYLSAHEFFAGTDGERAISVISANDKSLITKAEQAILSMGLCVIVAPLGGDYAAHSADCLYFEPARFTCRIRENQQTNRGSSGTKQPADYVAEVCAMLLKNYRPTGPDGTTFLTGSGILCNGIAPGEDEKGITAWDMVFTCDGGVRTEPVRQDFTTTPLPGAMPV